MRPLLATLALILIAPAASAQSVNLQGVWQYVRINMRGETYSGNITIEGNGKASDVTKRPVGSYVRQSGYVAVKKGGKVEIVYTSVVTDSGSYNPDHFYCTIQSERALSCSNTDTAGSTSDTFAVIRVGGPSPSM